MKRLFRLLAVMLWILVLAGSVTAEKPLTPFLKDFLSQIEGSAYEQYVRLIIGGRREGNELWLRGIAPVRDAVALYLALYPFAPVDEPFDFVWSWLHPPSDAEFINSWWRSAIRCVGTLEYLRTSDIQRVTSRLPAQHAGPDPQAGTATAQAAIDRLMWNRWLFAAMTGAHYTGSFDVQTSDLVPMSEQHFAELTSQTSAHFCGQL